MKPVREERCATSHFSWLFKDIKEHFVKIREKSSDDCNVLSRSHITIVSQMAALSPLLKDSE